MPASQRRLKAESSSSFISVTSSDSESVSSKTQPAMPAPTRSTASRARVACRERKP